MAEYETTTLAYDYFKLNCCCCFSCFKCCKKSKIGERYSKASDRLNKELDIVTIVKNLRKFSFLTDCFLNDYHFDLLSASKAYAIDDKESDEESDEDEFGI